MAQLRHIMRIELTEKAKKNLSTLSDKHGMTQVAMMSRVVQFFADQNELVQSAMLGRFPDEIKHDVAKLILQRMAG